MTRPAWVFGYASLIWRQDFPFLDSRRARIEGWARRLWQGSHDHRGTATDPGRVATLVEAPGETCDGRAFLVEPDVFEHLDHREKNGYERLPVRIRFDDATIDGVTYVAPRGNHAFLGPAPLAEMATQIRRCRGESGSNVDYVLELARALRDHGIDDPHIFGVERVLRESS
ncbi:MAG: gamma-glutamylcyclotransferase [Woeseiaceae bacterium]|nr:gamma-glutamylcyclotransferase [Woeseiaceae bacterium]